jgi:MtN3 and saliva related transmembrane protein
MVAVAFSNIVALRRCEDLIPLDAQSLLVPGFPHPEIFGFIAGLGTTFAAAPDLLATLGRRSSADMNPPKDGGHHGRLSDPLGVLRLADCFTAVIAWNVIAVLIKKDPFSSVRLPSGGLGL